ncbi:MAG: hypothetical protein OEM52_02055 [bacterium]|nr:hypothetical protein [bacterium]
MSGAAHLRLSETLVMHDSTLPVGTDIRFWDTQEIMVYDSTFNAILHYDLLMLHADGITFDRHGDDGDEFVRWKVSGIRKFAMWLQTQIAVDDELDYATTDEYTDLLQSINTALKLFDAGQVEFYGSTDDSELYFKVW